MDVRETSAFMEVSFRAAYSATTVLGVTHSPTAWEIREKRFNAKQEGQQKALNPKLPRAKWDGTGPTHDHHEYMLNLHIQLADAGMPWSNQTFYPFHHICAQIAGRVCRAVQRSRLRH